MPVRGFTYVCSVCQKKTLCADFSAGLHSLPTTSPEVHRTGLSRHLLQEMTKALCNALLCLDNSCLMASVWGRERRICEMLGHVKFKVEY